MSFFSKLFQSNPAKQAAKELALAAGAIEECPVCHSFSCKLNNDEAIKNALDYKTGWIKHAEQKNSFTEKELDDAVSNLIQQTSYHCDCETI